MVWAEMVMGRNGHGPKWLWAEMTSDRPDLSRLTRFPGSVSRDTAPYLLESFGIRLWSKGNKRNRRELIVSLILREETNLYEEIRKLMLGLEFFPLGRWGPLPAE